MRWGRTVNRVSAKIYRAERKDVSLVDLGHSIKSWKGLCLKNICLKTRSYNSAVLLRA